MDRHVDQVDINLLLMDPLRPREDLALTAFATIQAMDAERWIAHVDDATPGEIEATLMERYSWTADAARQFLVDHKPPQLSLFEKVGALRTWGSDLDNRNPATSQIADMIVMHIRPQATKEEVGEAYDHVRRQMYQRAFKRKRPIGLERTRDLAVLGYRIWRGDFETWRGALATYTAEHPNDAATFADIGEFRRATRKAYNTVTGCTLDFRPGMKARKGGETE